MEYKSKKSEQFAKWFGGETGIDPTVPAFEKIVELERAARMVVHDFDTVGDATEQDIRALARAVKELGAEYASK